MFASICRTRQVVALEEEKMAGLCWLLKCNGVIVKVGIIFLIPRTTVEQIAKEKHIISQFTC